MFLLWTLLVFCTAGRASLAEERNSVEVKMADIMDRISRMETDIAGMREEIDIRDELISDMKEAMETKDKRLAVLEAAVETSDVEVKSLSERVKETEELREVVEQPYAFYCAWQDYWIFDDTTITYDRLTFYSKSDGPESSNLTRGFDLSTGVFTVGEGFGGIWSVSFAIKSQTHSGESNTAYLYLNGQRIEESYHFTSYYGQVYVESLGSRTLYMRLQEADTLCLATGKIGWGFYDINLCLQLVKPD